MTTAKKIGLAVLVLAALAGATWALDLGGVRTAIVGSDGGGDAGGLQLYGTIERRDAALAFRIAEHIATVEVDEGERVEKGQVLATLERDALEARLREAEARIRVQDEVVRRLENGARPEEIARAEAEVRAAEARRNNVNSEVARLRQTAASGATSRQALDDALARLEVETEALAATRKTLDLVVAGPREEDIAEARARVDELRAAVAVIQNDLDDTVLKAPAAGVVESRILEPGEFAAPERPVLLLALTGEKWVRAHLPEPQLGHVRPGSGARVFSDSFPGRAFAGQVGFISPTAEFTPKTVQTTDLRPHLVYEVRIRLEDPDDRLRLGQPVTVEIAEPKDG